MNISKPSRLLNIGVEPMRTMERNMSQRNLQSNASGGISSEHYVFKDYKKRKYLDPHTHMKMYAKFVNDKSKISRRGSVEKV